MARVVITRPFVSQFSDVQIDDAKQPTVARLTFDVAGKNERYSFAMKRSELEHLVRKIQQGLKTAPLLSQRP